MPQSNPLAIVRKKRGYLLSYHRRHARPARDDPPAPRREGRHEQVAESLSFALLHCGGPTMLAAMDCWIQTAKRDRIPAPFPGKV